MSEKHITANSLNTYLDYIYDDYKRLSGVDLSVGSETSPTLSIDYDYTYRTYTDGGNTYTDGYVSTFKATVKGVVRTYTYTYDDAGNILSQSKYALTYSDSITSTAIETKAYTYSPYNWGDQLIAYGGQTITYDTLGNPLSYYNGSSYSFTWTGRQLATANCNGKTISYTYNDEGIRTSKTVDGVTTTYHLIGSQIIAEETDTYIIVYLYDAAGSPIGMQYRGSTYGTGWDTYFFEKNLQGDIVAVYNRSGTKLVTYKYDAWGNTTVSYLNNGASTSATRNPFTYRGYYYDSETKLYYLNSRYYDSAIGRFVSPDSYVSTGQGLLGYNMYAYCNNNPVTRSDQSGDMWQFVPALDPRNCTYGASDGMLFTGGSSGYYYDSSAYRTYQLRMSTARYDAGLGGYYYGGGSSFGGYTGQFATGGRVSVTDSMATGGGKSYASKNVGERKQEHGNSLNYGGVNYGYVLVDSNRNILKFGETINPLTRYSQKYLRDNQYSMIILVQGTKRDIHYWQHDLNLYYLNKYGELPPLNKRGW